MKKRLLFLICVVTFLPLMLSAKSFLECVDEGDLKCVKHFVEKLEQNVNDQDGKKAFANAIANSRKEIVEYLLNKGVDVNGTYNNNSFVKFCYHKDIFNLLLSKGAKIPKKVVEKDGQRNLEFSLYFYSLIQLIVQDYKIKGGEFTYDKEQAKEFYDYLDLVEEIKNTLEKQKIKIDYSKKEIDMIEQLCDGNNDMLIKFAVFYGDTKKIKELLKKGVDPKQRTSWRDRQLKNSPIDYAVKLNQEAVIKLFKDLEYM